MKITLAQKYFRLGMLAASVVLLFSIGDSQQMPDEYQNILVFLGRQGDYQDGVFKVNIPRNDLTVTVSAVAVPTPFGFGGWLAMTKGDSGNDVMMGDLVLLQDEVNPVMSALLDNDLEVTALHNHFFWEEPRIFYMHVHGHGRAIDLAKKVKPALALIGHIAGQTGTSTIKKNAGEIIEGKLNTDKLNHIIGHKGDRTGVTYKIVIGRDDIQVKEMGAVINARMGLNTWAAFIGTDEKAAIAGDIAMLGDEVTSVLKALRKNGLNVVAIHHHMTGTNPMIIFLHYWGVGSAEQLATGFRAALDKLGNGTGGMKMHY
jgi:hypothetical protein